MKVGSLDLLNCSLITLGEFIRLICRCSLSEPCGALSCLIRWEVLKFLAQTLLFFGNQFFSHKASGLARYSLHWHGIFIFIYFV